MFSWIACEQAFTSTRFRCLPELRFPPLLTLIFDDRLRRKLTGSRRPEATFQISRYSSFNRRASRSDGATCYASFRRIGLVPKAILTLSTSSPMASSPTVVISKKYCFLSGLSLLELIYAEVPLILLTRMPTSLVRSTMKPSIPLYLAFIAVNLSAPA
jgi:hypothetical protein